MNVAEGWFYVDQITGGVKGTKEARYDLIPAKALDEVARQYGRGAKKYDDRNWERGYPWSLSYAALQRHAWAFWGGETNDPETGLNHMAAVVFHALALITFGETHPEQDDRPNNESPEDGQQGATPPTRNPDPRSPGSCQEPPTLTDLEHTAECLTSPTAAQDYTWPGTNYPYRPVYTQSG